MFSLLDHTREDWSTIPRRPKNRDIDYWEIVEVHHSGSSNRGTSLAQLAALERAMVSGAFNDIWYHLVILEDGLIVEGRGVEASNSTRPYLTVLLMGDYTEVGANEAQLDALKVIVDAFGGQVTWHDERAQKLGTGRTACCGAALIAQIEEMRTVKVTTLPTPAPLPANTYPADAPVVTVLADDKGYAIVCTDGGVFAFGGFPFAGSAAPHLSAGDSIVSAATTPTGYVLLAASGAMFCFDTPYHGRVQVK